MRALIGVELLRKLPAGPCDVRDTKLPGFVLRVRPSGQHSYYAQYARGKWQRLGTTKTMDVVKARAEARQILADVVKGADPVAARQARKASITLDVFITKHYGPWASANRKTGEEQTTRFRSTFKDLLDKPLTAIAGFDIERWRSARLQAGVQPSTVNRNLNVIRGALSRAVDWNLLTAHPMRKVKASKTDRGGVVRYLSADEDRRLRAALTARDDTRRAERDRANLWRRERGYADWPAYGTYTDHLTPIILMALHTGLRRGELFQLRWRDVDLTRALVTVQGATAKTGQTRHVPLNTDIVTVLQDWRPAKPAAEAFVFPGRVEGEALDDIKTAWAAIVGPKAANIQAFRFHDCRHTFASRLVMAGVDLNTVRELLGHSDIKMVLRYAHLAPEHTAAAVAKLVAHHGA